MKILLTGCDGLLGQSLIRLKPQGYFIHGLGRRRDPLLTLDGYSQVDMANSGGLVDKATQVAPDFIINTAAFTHVDLCEIHPQESFKVNRDAPIALSKFPMVHISSDYVFDGKSGPYKESDPTGPLSVYGQSKLESEFGVLKGNPKSLVVRTMSLWGEGIGCKTSFPEFVKKNLVLGEKIKVTSDQIGTPTHVDDLAQAIWILLQNGLSGLFHVAGSETLSRLKWAELIAEKNGLDKRLIEPCDTQSLRQEAKRPLNSGLLCDKLWGLTGFRPRGVS